jgi:hypothetical protein
LSVVLLLLTPLDAKRSGATRASKRNKKVSLCSRIINGKMETYSWSERSAVVDQSHVDIPRLNRKKKNQNSMQRKDKTKKNIRFSEALILLFSFPFFFVSSLSFESFLPLPIVHHLSFPPSFSFSFHPSPSPYPHSHSCIRSIPHRHLTPTDTPQPTSHSTRPLSNHQNLSNIRIDLRIHVDFEPSLPIRQIRRSVGGQPNSTD